MHLKVKKPVLILFLFFSFFTNAQKPFALVELFTSEGCSSCPPADVLLSKIGINAEKSGQNIFLLAFHVDYWNKGGWKDPFSKYQFTLRQENYSRVLSEKEMYTPQVVINGETSFTGSREDKMNDNIKQALAVIPKISLITSKDSVKNDTLYLHYKISNTDPNFVLRFVLTEDGLISDVKNGENKGKILNHDHVVKLFFSVDTPKKEGQVKISLKGNKLSEKNQVITFVQHKQSMKVLAAEKIKIK